MAGNIFQWPSRHIVGGQVLHGISAGVISGAGWSEHMGVLLGTGRCDIAKTPTLSKRFTVVFRIEDPGKWIHGRLMLP